jgi:hypothetical protein
MMSNAGREERVFMPQNVSWTTEYDGVDVEIVKNVEINIQRHFSQEYLECVLHYQGGQPSLRHLDVPNYGTVLFVWLLVFAEGDELDILEQYNVARKNVSEDIFPFAYDTNINALCFDYRSSKEAPTIVYWDEQGLSSNPSRENVFPICQTFSELLERLY